MQSTSSSNTPSTNVIHHLVNASPINSIGSNISGSASPTVFMDHSVPGSATGATSSTAASTVGGYVVETSSSGATLFIQSHGLSGISKSRPASIHRHSSNSSPSVRIFLNSIISLSLISVWFLASSSSSFCWSGTRIPVYRYSHWALSLKLKTLKFILSVLSLFNIFSI